MSVRGGGRERTMKEERGRNPPSRHLWVGNLPHGISERELADRFLRFGELESVAFQPARSYAFLNFKHDDDAFAAIDSLQGFPLAGNPLRIEFAKADKSSSRTEDIYRHDEQRSAARGSPFVQKDSRMRYESPDTYSKSKMSDRDAEPSEVLYIGFPASLKVDEALLRKVFSPFGDITKVTIFPGRSYAFVQFRSLMAACKAKETLQGKLFGNPRVHISFAKSEPSSSSSGRGPSGRSLSPPYRSVDRLGSSERYFQDRNYGSISRISSVRDPHYIADRDWEESEDYMFSRKGASRNEYDGGPAYRRSRSRSPHKLPQDMHEYHDSPRRMGSSFRDDPHRFPSRSSVHEEPWGLPEEDYYYQETKRLKTRSLQPERQLPCHLISGVEQERRPFSRASADFSPKDAFDRNYEAGQLRYKQTVEKPLNLAIRNGEKSSFREPHDELMGAFSRPEGKRYTLEPDRPSLKDWNWEGTIAKGGNPICRAKCFPVGKVMDMMLPEFLDCTARTGLDMLAKHYYQSSQAWVVFFVPGSDADIVFYNEFMHYLEEKQRAAVSKLDDTTTLFLVPPSDFSEKVLKVPGKLSISGVILRLEYGSSGYGPVQQQGERKGPDLLTSYGETPYSEDSGAFADVGNQRNPGPSAFLRSAARDVRHSPMDPYIESRHDRYSGLDWPPRDASVTNTRSSQMQTSMDLQEHSGFVPGKQQNADPSRFRETEIPSGFQPEQLAHLASSMSRQQEQVDHTSNQPDRYAPDGRASFQHLQHVQTPSIPPGFQNVQLQSSSNIQEEEENEANPQKRLQATLQLAAALLQQIQQAKN